MKDLKRLRGLDAAFLYMETPSQHMHISVTMIFDPARDDVPRAARETPEHPRADVDAAAARLAHVLLRRLVARKPFRRRLSNAPLRLTHPAWINSPGFEPRDHLRHATLPSPGTLEQLADFVAGVAATPLDRRRPLWQLWTIVGLADGRTAVVLKVHHAMLDGVSGLEVLARLFTTEPDATGQEPTDAPVYDDHGPSSMRRATSALASMGRGPANVAHALVDTGRSLLPLARSSMGLARSTLRLSLPFSAQRTSLNHALTPGRTVAFGRVPLASVKRIKNAFGVTINDVVLTACTMALRDHLHARGEHPKRAIIATIPVSDHAQGDTGAFGNRVSAMFIGLPVHLDGALEVLSTVNAHTVGAKKIHAAFTPAVLSNWAELAPPALFAGAAALYSHWKLAEHLPPSHSVVISNVAGSPVPLYAADARLVAAYPLGPILEGAVLNVTVLSYAGSLDVGLIACPESVPRPDEIARAFERAVAELESHAITRPPPAPRADVVQ